MKKIIFFPSYTMLNINKQRKLYLLAILKSRGDHRSVDINFGLKSTPTTDTLVLVSRCMFVFGVLWNLPTHHKQKSVGSGRFWMFWRRDDVCFDEVKEKGRTKKTWRHNSANVETTLEFALLPLNFSVCYCSYFHSKNQISLIIYCYPFCCKFEEVLLQNWISLQTCSLEIW